MPLAEEENNGNCYKNRDILMRNLHITGFNDPCFLVIGDICKFKYLNLLQKLDRCLKFQYFRNQFSRIQALKLIKHTLIKFSKL